MARRFLCAFLARGALAGWLLAYAASLHFVYRSLISGPFAYMGLRYLQRPFAEYAFAYLAAMLPAMWLPRLITRPSCLAVWLLTLVAYVPSVLVPLFSSDLRLVVLLPLYIGLLLAVGSLTVVTRIPPLAVPTIRTSSSVFWLIFGLLALSVYLSLIGVFGLRPPPSVLTPYGVRLEARDVVALHGAYVGYALRLGSNVVGPFAMAVGLLRRRSWLFLLGAFLQGLVYSFDGTKTTLLAPAVIVVTWWLLKRGPFKAAALLKGIVTVVLAGATVDLVIGSPVVSALLTRRLLLVPGLLTSLYYQFFSANEPFYWSHSILKFLFSNPYGTTPAFLIGAVFFGSAATSANAHIWADGFANAGFVGLFAVTLVLGSYLWLLDSVGRGKYALAVLATLVPMAAVTQTSVLTSLLTHGLLAALLFVWIAPRTVV